LNSTHRHIIQRIEQLAGGSILFPTDFRGLGSENAIKMSLSRLVREKLVERLAHGVYLKPKRARKGAATLIMQEIALAIAKKEQVRIRLSGEFALFKLGLRAAEPDYLSYVTDGEPRNIRIADQRLVFKATTPKKLNLSEGTSGLLIQAIEELGNAKITPAISELIMKHLKGINEEVLNADLRLASAWVYELIRQLKLKIKQASS
jgi:hypothetical protein